MSIEATSKLNILQQSPHDFCPQPVEPAEPETKAVQWLPSRYNVRVTTTDGKLVLWNTYTSAMSVFEPEERSTVEMLLSQKGFEAPDEGGVKYLHERGFLVKEEASEFRRFQLAFGHQQYRTDVLQLILLATEDCNFRCTYCYEKFARGTMQPWVRTGIKELVKKRVANGLRNLSISWFGGEPLYGFEAIEDLAPFFHEIAEEHSLGYHSTMTTNGYLLTPDVAEKLLLWRVRKFQITLDGPPENHDRSRPARNGEGTFATILQNLQAMSRRPDEFQIDIRVNFDRTNYPNLDHFFDIVEKEFRGDPRFKIRFRAVGQWGGENDDQLDVCGNKEASDIHMELKKEASKRGLTITEDDDIRKLKGVAAPTVCYAARPYHFIVGTTGKLMKCTIDLDSEDRNVVGKITENGDLKLDQDKFTRWTEPAFERDTKCQQCIILPVCQGISCPQKRIKSDRSPCLALRTNVKKELKVIAEIAEMGSDQRNVVVGGQSSTADPGQVSTVAA